MLAWEEGSSYWSLKVSWRVFFCAMATLLFTYLVAESKAVRNSKFVNQSYVESYAGRSVCVNNVYVFYFWEAFLHTHIHTHTPTHPHTHNRLLLYGY
jgi:hypothetical protein